MTRSNLPVAILTVNQIRNQIIHLNYIVKYVHFSCVKFTYRIRIENYLCTAHTVFSVRLILSKLSHDYSYYFVVCFVRVRFHTWPKRQVTSGKRKTCKFTAKHGWELSVLDAYHSDLSCAFVYIRTS